MPLAKAARRADTLRVTSCCGQHARPRGKVRAPEAAQGPRPHGRAGTPSATPSQEAPAAVSRPPPQRSGSDPHPGGITRTEGPDAAGEGRRRRRRKRRRARHGSVPAGEAPPLRAAPPLPGEGEAEAALRAVALPPAAARQELLQSPPQHRLLFPSPTRSIPATRDSSERSAQAPLPPPPSPPAPGTASDLPGRGRPRAQRRSRLVGAFPAPRCVPAVLWSTPAWTSLSREEFGRCWRREFRCLMAGNLYFQFRVQNVTYNIAKVE